MKSELGRKKAVTEKMTTSEAQRLSFSCNGILIFPFNSYLLNVQWLCAGLILRTSTGRVAGPALKSSQPLRMLGNDSASRGVPHSSVNEGRKELFSFSSGAGLPWLPSTLPAFFWVCFQQAHCRGFWEECVKYQTLLLQARLASL